jgi:hypothetical protein
MQIIGGGPPTTPTEWIGWLDSKLATQRGNARRYADYYDSNSNNLAFAQMRFREAFGDMFMGWQVNFCPLVVDSVSERIRVQGFRMTDEPGADKDAQEIWQRNYLDADSNAVHIDALALGSAYATVWADKKTKKPLVVAESAMDMAVQYYPGSRRNIMAALKRWCDDWGTEHATLYLPDGVWTSEGTAESGLQPVQWREPQREKNPLGVVPVVPFMNRTRLRQKPFSELEPIIPLADAITKIAADALVASEYAAFPQRYIAGMEVELDDNGNPISPFAIALDKILTAEDPSTVFGQFAAADLGNYVKLIDNYVAALAAISRIPFHYFLIGRNGQAPSGEAITSAEAGLVAKAKERQLVFGESWEEVMRLSFKVLNDPRAEAFQAETIWADPEYKSQASLIDGAVKQVAGLDVPRPVAWEVIGYTPEQIERFDALREVDDALAKRAATQAADAAKAMSDALPKPDVTAPTGGKSNTPKNTTAK